MQCDAAVVEMLYSCGVCALPHVFPMAQCHNGHMYCRPCLERAGRCPTCRVDVSDPARCLLGDAVAEALAVPIRCRWGCEFSAPTPRREAHEAFCDRRMVECPVCASAGVAHRVQMCKLLEHYVSDHCVPHSTGHSGQHWITLPTGEPTAGSSSLILVSGADSASPPPVVVHLERLTNSGLCSVWAQSTCGPSADPVWEIELSIGGPLHATCCVFPVDPIRSAGDTIKRPATAPRVDLLPFPGVTAVRIKVRTQASHAQDGSQPTSS